MKELHDVFGSAVGQWDEKREKRGQDRLTAAMPNSALEGDAARSAAPLGLVR